MPITSTPSTNIFTTTTTSTSFLTSTSTRIIPFATTTSTGTSTLSNNTTPPRYEFIDLFIKVSDLLPYGSSNGDNTLTRADDSSFYISLSNNYYFYDTEYNYFYVCTNGFVSTDSTSWVSSFSNLDSPLVAGFATDLVTNSAGNIFYRETTDSSILAQLKSYIIAYNSSTSSLNLRSAFIVTYDNVPFYGSSSTYNSCQLGETLILIG